VKDVTDNIIHDEFNSKDVIPVKEYVKPFKEKSKRIKCKLFPKAQRRESTKILIRWLIRAISQNL
jgi:hypothetical protein